MENWQTLLFDLMRGEIPKLMAVFYLILWIFVGNFILLNLFLAILLDSFIEEDEEEESEEEDEEASGDPSSVSSATPLPSRALM